MTWAVRRLSEICEINLGKTPSRSNKLYWDAEKVTSNIWVSIADLTRLNGQYISDSKEYISVQGASLFRPVKAGTLLMSFKLSIGKLAYAGCDLYTNEAIVALPIKNKNEINPNFLYYYLQSYDWDKETENDIKLKGKTLNKAKLKEIKVPVPSLLIQQKIVEKLDEIFAEIDKAIVATEANIKNAETLFQSYLAEVFDGNKNSKTCILGDVVTRLTNGYVGATKNIYLDSGIPYLLARHVKNNVLSFDGKTFISNEFNTKNKKSILKEDDVLLVQSGHIGHSAVVTKEHEGHNCHAMIVISTIKDILSGKFLSLYFQSSYMKQVFEDMRTGSTIKHLNCGDVRLLEIPVPSIEEQNKIVKKSEEIDVLIKSIAENKIMKTRQLNYLRSRVLENAFVDGFVGGNSERS